MYINSQNWVNILVIIPRMVLRFQHLDDLMFFFLRAHMASVSKLKDIRMEAKQPAVLSQCVFKILPFFLGEK